MKRKEPTLWTAEKQQFLEDNLQKPPKFIATALDTSYHTIRRKIMEIECRTNTSILEKYARWGVEIPKPKFVRPKAEYSNMLTGSALIAKILSED